VLHFAVHSLNLLRPFALQLRFVGACSLLGLFVWSLLGIMLETFARAKEMHQIPCTKCYFFTGDYRLKCTVNPKAANTEQAIGCPEFQEKSRF